MGDNEKTLWSIEKDINDFLCSEECIKFRLDLRNAHGLTRERAERFIEYVNEYIENNISSFIHIGNNVDWCRFFDSDKYINVSVKYVLPNQETEYCNIGMLFACTTQKDITNMRLWAESTNVYVRLEEQYLYADVSNSFGKAYKMLNIVDIHKAIIKRRKDEIIEECKKSVKQVEREIQEKIKCKNGIKEKMREVENWRL